MCAPTEVEIWSDVVCPWCYIGKRRFETARRRSSPTRSTSTSCSGRSSSTRPRRPARPDPVVEAYAKKFGGPERAQQIIDHVTGRGGRERPRVPHGPGAARQHAARPSAAVARRERPATRSR